MATANIGIKKKIVTKTIEVEEVEQVINLQLTLEEAATLRAVAGYTHIDTTPGTHIGNLYSLLSGFHNEEMKIIPEKRIKFEVTQMGSGLRILPK